MIQGARPPPPVVVIHEKDQTEDNPRSYLYPLQPQTQVTEQAPGAGGQQMFVSGMPRGS